MGLTLTFEDFRQVLATPGRIFAGFALQYSVMPAMAYAVSRAMALPLPFTIGWVGAHACPWQGLQQQQNLQQEQQHGSMHQRRGGGAAHSGASPRRCCCAPDQSALPRPPLPPLQAVHRGFLPRRHRQQRRDLFGKSGRDPERGHDNSQHGAVG